MKTTISPVTSGHPCRHHSESPADIASEQAADIAGIRSLSKRPKRIRSIFHHPQFRYAA
jgi:hypothetical protein